MVSFSVACDLHAVQERGQKETTFFFLPFSWTAYMGQF